MVQPNVSGYQVYQKNKYDTASPHKLIQMLYDAALTNVRHAAHALENRDNDSSHRALLKVQDILYELMSCLNVDQGGDIAKNLQNIYFYLINQLVMANVNKNRDILREVEGHILELREAWVVIGKDVSIGTRG